MLLDGVNAELIALAQIILAMVLGGIVGIERESKDRSAGLRTHMLMAGGACLVVLLGPELVFQLNQDLPDGALNTDPYRLLQAIITGVGFIAAGTIIRSPSENSIRGLTTACSLFFTAIIGICTALEKFALALGLALSTVAILWAVRKFEARILNSKN